MEIWKDVIGYEGIYKVSSLGRIKRISKNHLCNLRYQGEYYLKPLDNGKGYLRMKLSNNGTSKRVMLHRIIAEAFITNPENKKVINHINCNKKDNRIENLEWCSQSENVLHSVKLGRWTQGRKKINKNIVYIEI
jgi:hypothetical protein